MFIQPINRYEYLRSMDFPLPCKSVLCQRIAKLHFAPGMQNSIIEWMDKAMENSPQHERMCCLMLDEMQISQAIEYDPCIKRLVGYVSPELRQPNQPEEAPASHALCFMVKGITKKWKQIIGND